MRKPVMVLQVVMVLLIGSFLSISFFSPPNSSQQAAGISQITESKISAQIPQENESSTDLSDIAIFGAEDAKFVVLDESGQKVGDGSVSRIGAAGEDAPDAYIASMEYYVSEPQGNVFYLQVESGGSENLVVFIYDKGVNVKKLEIPSAGKENVRFKIIYDKENIQNSTYEQQ